MEPKCPKCGGEMKLVPAGLSKKTGKPYQEFYSCKKWECGGTAKSPQTSVNPQNVANAQWTPKQPSGADFERLVALLEDIKSEVESINKKIPLRDPESGDIIPF
jgi:hypothetical protein